MVGSYLLRNGTHEADGELDKHEPHPISPRAGEPVGTTASRPKLAVAPPFTAAESLDE